MVESRTIKLIHHGRVKNSINLIIVESMTPLIYLIDRVNDSN